jgi:hypothetical protein
MTDDTKNLLIKGAVVIALFVVVSMSLRWFLRSDHQRISEAVDDARDALVELRDDDFLAVFTDDLVYRGDRDIVALRRDLASWRAAAIGSVIIVEKEIEVDGHEADVTLLVAAGQSVIQLGQVEVELEAEKGEDGEWRVRRFDWKRR